MNVLIGGGNGFLGQALTAALLQQGHQVTVISRTPHNISAPVQAMRLTDLTPAHGFDAVINLTGAGIADARWSDARKQELRDSRLKTTQALIDWMNTAQQRPTVLLSGSAIGWYGAQGETCLTENSPAHPEFVQQLCADWEACAEQAAALGVRTVLLRTGVVLDPAGGLLARVRLPFLLGLGGRLGDGQQWMSWISRHDWVQAVTFLLTDPTLHGAFNLCSPHPVRNVEFTQTLAGSLSRPAWLPAPAIVLQVLLGEMSGLLLDSQRVLPQRLMDVGFQFQHPLLKVALQNLG
jgi:uncharacterized protein (TIGR01777 family)